jgi:hypothetical protein
MPVKFVTEHGERNSMDTVTYLQKQFSNLNGLLHSIAGDLTGEELLARSARGQLLRCEAVKGLVKMPQDFSQGVLCFYPNGRSY